MNRMIPASVFLFLVAAMATAQSLLPQPQIIDHQIVTGSDVASFTATEGVKSAYNILEVVVTCNNAGTYDEGCLYEVTDGSGTAFNDVSFWVNTTNNWTEQIFYILEPNTGTQTITAYTNYLCSCTFYALVQQIQGIGTN